jgi:hypothetical protein
MRRSACRQTSPSLDRRPARLLRVAITSVAIPTRLFQGRFCESRSPLLLVRVACVGPVGSIGWVGQAWAWSSGERSELRDRDARAGYGLTTRLSAFPLLVQMRSNYPFDLFGDHRAVEVKTGKIDVLKGSQKWRITCGLRISKKQRRRTGKGFCALGSALRALHRFT